MSAADLRRLACHRWLRLPPPSAAARAIKQRQKWTGREAGTDCKGHQGRRRACRIVSKALSRFAFRLCFCTHQDDGPLGKRGGWRSCLQTIYSNHGNVSVQAWQRTSSSAVSNHALQCVDVWKFISAHSQCIVSALQAITRRENQMLNDRRPTGTHRSQSGIGAQRGTVVAQADAFICSCHPSAGCTRSPHHRRRGQSIPTLGKLRTNSLHICLKQRSLSKSPPTNWGSRKGAAACLQMHCCLAPLPPPDA